MEAVAHLGEDLLVNGVDIFDAVEAAAKAFFPEPFFRAAKCLIAIFRAANCLIAIFQRRQVSYRDFLAPPTVLSRFLAPPSALARFCS